MTPLANSIRRVSSSDGGILLDIRRGTMFRLNPLATRILDLLDRGESPSRIVEQISAEFEIALDLVQTDVNDFLDALKLHGVLDSRGLKEQARTGG
jgi:hypothetical protein